MCGHPLPSGTCMSSGVRVCVHVLFFILERTKDLRPISVGRRDWTPENGLEIAIRGAPLEFPVRVDI